MDRIDIQCEITPVPFSDISRQQAGESSEEIRKRVIAARKMQEERFDKYYSENPSLLTGGSGRVFCNAQMTDRMLHQFCALDSETTTMLHNAMNSLSLSARAYSRILKVARTIADLDGKENIELDHIAEAVGYRQIDRGDWAER